MGKVIEINEFNNIPKTTKLFLVSIDRGNKCIGRIIWVGKLKEYCFYPNNGTILSSKPMEKILNFMYAETKKHSIKTIKK